VAVVHVVPVVVVVPPVVPESPVVPGFDVLVLPASLAVLDAVPHVHTENAVPAALHDWTPLTPPEHSHACCAFGVHEVVAELVVVPPQAATNRNATEAASAAPWK
jgi:hypothetical protein